ncbi:MAG: rod shape-determining protein [Ruminococcus sp.]|nr:rod shape-determining protein [Ruminococcus sp.]MCM1478152.1 rod shape-determining protein [Muribaculaceae bacterium]
MDIGIDLGTANVLISVGNKGVVLNEPSVVAFNKKINEIVAIGAEAYKMIGRTPEYITVVRPLSDGVISDHKMTERMIMAFIEKVTGKQLLMPNIIMCIPSSITDVESRAVIEAAKIAGARQVYLIEEPVAAIMGAGVDISSPDGNMVVDIGGGTTDIAVVSMNGVVAKLSMKVAGGKLDKAIVRYVSSRYRILIGEKTAENAKMAAANVYSPDGSRKVTIKGRHLVRGLPEQIELTDYDIYEAIIDNIQEMIDGVRDVAERTPPELAGDVYRNGIYLTGGGALLFGLDKLMTSQLGVKCIVPDDPLSCVAKGTRYAFKNIDKLLDGFEHVSMYK